MKNLKPCPFCGYAWPVLNYMLPREEGDSRKHYLYSCPMCGAMSEPRRRITDAAEAWNAGHMAEERT